jgi:hypothetical protein
MLQSEYAQDSYWVLNLNEERNVVFEDHISFLQSIGIKQTKKAIFLWCLTPLSTIFLLYRGGITRFTPLQMSFDNRT